MILMDVISKILDGQKEGKQQIAPKIGPIPFINIINHFIIPHTPKFIAIVV